MPSSCQSVYFTLSQPLLTASASHPYGASCYLVNNINVFGALGGFRALRNRLYACFEAATEVCVGREMVPATTADAGLFAFARWCE